MKKILLIIPLLLISCKKDAESYVNVGKNKDFKVELIFEIDGIKMYRFYDGRTHYFTNRGETITSQQYNSGKQHYTIEENIN
jgi:hypothetical protein